MSVSGFAIVVGGRGLLRAVQSSAKLRGRFVAFAGGCAGPAAVAPAAAGVGLRGLSTNSRAAVATTSVSGPIAASRGAVTSRGTMGSCGTSLSSRRPLYARSHGACRRMPNCLGGLGSSSWSARRLSFPAFHIGDRRAERTTEKLRGRRVRAASLARSRSPQTSTPPALRRRRTVAPSPLACTRTARASGRTSSSSPRTRSGPPGSPSASSACTATCRPSASRYLAASAARAAFVATSNDAGPAPRTSRSARSLKGGASMRRFPRSPS